MKRLSFIISSEDSKNRLDRFLATQLSDISRSVIQKLITSGAITLNGKHVKVGEPLHESDTITVNIPPPQSSKIAPEKIPLNIIYEDKDVLIINKPAGLVIHPAAGHSSGTLVNALLHYDPALSTVGGSDRPGIVHRLDKGTSGVLVVARNEMARLVLLKQFKERSIQKEYWALVHGVMAPLVGKFESALGRHPQHRKKFASTSRGKAALTEYRVGDTYSGLFCEVRLKLHTGRTHQIRVHLSEAGHPILGDKTYGGRRDVKKSLPENVRNKVQEMGRPALHAALIGFKHPRSGQDIKFEAPLPEDLRQLIKILGGL